MTNSIASCYALLRPLRLYSLSGETLVDAELMAYDAGFSIIESRLTTLYNEAFIQTAEGYGLSRREQMLQLWQRPQSNITKRRELLIYRIAVAPNDYTLEGIISSVKAAGLNAHVLEDIPNGRIKIIEDGFISDFENIDAVKDEVRYMLPAHLDADFEIGNFTWEQFEASGVSFDNFNAKDITWAKFDIDGRNIFKEEENSAKHT